MSLSTFLRGAPPRPSRSLDELAASIQQHLRRVEAHMAAAVPRSTVFQSPIATRWRRTVAVSYRVDEEPAHLSLAQAEHYLAGLEAGTEDTHDVYFAAHPLPILAKPLVPGSLRDLAARIHAHLRRLEADPVRNPLVKQGGMDLRWLFDSQAVESSRFVWIRYVGRLSDSRLSKTEAEHYLAGLDGGYVGRHTEYFAAYPVPGSPAAFAATSKAADEALYARPVLPAPDGGPRIAWAGLRRMPELFRAVSIPWDMTERYLRQQQESGLDIDPPFQREHVWTDAQRSAWIEHVLRGGETGRTLTLVCRSWAGHPKPGYVLADGRQRLETVRRFLRGEVRVFPDVARPEGYAVQDFEGSYPWTDLDLTWRVVICPTEADTLRLYLAMNRGGTPHSPAEIARVEAQLAALEAAEAPAGGTP